MLYVRAVLLASAIVLSSCATQQKKQKDVEVSDPGALGDRITRICTLPPAEREAEIEKLKKESGMVLYCGK